MGANVNMALFEDSNQATTRAQHMLPLAAKAHLDEADYFYFEPFSRTAKNSIEFIEGSGQEIVRHALVRALIRP